MARAISYIRFSTPDQALGDSERRQIEDARAYCSKHGLTLDDSDILRDLGLSAYRGANRREGALAVFLKAIEAGSIARDTTLIIEAWDRLSREPPIRAINQMTEIVLAGIRIVTLKDRQIHDEATVNAEPYRLFHSVALMIAANAESSLKGERVAKAWADKRKQAMVSKHILTPSRPAWVDLIDGKLVANKERAETVRRIFRMVASGMGCYTVARHLQKERVPTLSGDKKSNGWNKSRILAIIKSDAPLGVLHSYRRDGKKRIPAEIIEGYYPVIVDQTLANEARAAISGRRFGGMGAGRKGTVYSNLFTGIAKCAVCGASMFLANRLESRAKAGWLKCSNAVRTNGCDNMTGIAYKTLEESVLRDVGWFETLRKHLPRHDPSQEIAERIAEKEAEAERINATITRLTDTFADTPLPAIVAQIKERAERHAAIQAELTELREQYQQAFRKSEQSDVFAERERILESFASVDPKARYEVRARIASALRETIEAISCYPDRTVRLAFPTMQVQTADLGPKPLLNERKPLITEDFDDEVTIAAYFGAEGKGRVRVATGAGKPNAIHQLAFLIDYDQSLKSHMLMSVDGGEEREITGFAPSLLAYGIAEHGWDESTEDDTPPNF